MPTTEHHGGCLCGGVSYSVDGPLRRVVYCHCSQCRRTSGHFVAATACAPANLDLTQSETLRWYRSSESAERGFCATCGSSLFWKPDHGDYIAIMSGSLDAPTGLASREHIHVADASDYYDITDGLPQFPGDHEDLWERDGA